MVFAVRWVILSLSLLTTLGTILWVIFGLGGLGSQRTQLFNWHPVLATICALVLLPQGVLEWRSDRTSRIASKWIHALLLGVAFLGINIAIGIAYTAHSHQNAPNFYSIHSWVGVCAILLLKSNFAGGILSTVLPGWRVGKFSGGMHRRVGHFGVAFALIAAVLGFVELQTVVNTDSKRVFGWTSLVGGGLGVLAGVVGALVGVALVGQVERAGKGAILDADAVKPVIAI